MAEENVNAPLDRALLDAHITAVLQTAPRYQVPAGFAARVAAGMPPRTHATLTPLRYGRVAAVACLVVLFVLMVVLAHRAVGTSVFWVSLESIFCAQFALLAVWLVARDYTFLSNL